MLTDQQLHRFFRKVLDFFLVAVFLSTSICLCVPTDKFIPLAFKFIFSKGIIHIIFEIFHLLHTAGYNWAKYFERCNSVYFEGRAKRARDVYWAKYNGDSPDDPDNPDNPDDPVTKKYTIKYVLYDGENSDANPSSYKITTETITLKKAKKKGYTFCINGKVAF